MQTAENFYSTLATGNQQAIQTATAPATEAIAKNYQQAMQNISTTMPRGGARDLALQQAQVSEAGQIGGTQANAYLGSFPALANLSEGGIGLSINEVTQALSAFSGASQSNTSEGQMQSAGKAETLSFLGGLGQSAATGTGLAMSCWIAEVLFGECSLRTVRLRVYLNQVWAKHSLVGRIVMAAYGRWGKAVARQVAKRMWLRKLFVPIFLYADMKAFCWEHAQLPRLREAGLL